MSGEPIYHVCRRDEWESGKTAGYYSGSSQDAADGFIHFSTAGQVRASAAQHRSGQTGLVLLTVNAEVLGNSLRWEPSRSGALFPHLYGRLPINAVLRVDELPLNEDGFHVFPPEIPRGNR